jgi:hypothetical protein
MKNHFKLKREEAGAVIGPAIRPCTTPAITPQLKTSRG